MLHNTQSDLIVAAYLRTQFPDTAGVFLREAGLDEDVFSSSPIPDLRTIIEDWQSDQLNRRLARTALSKPDDTAIEELMHRSLPEPVGLQNVERIIAGVSVGNLLGVKVERIPRRIFDTTTASYRSDYPLSILVTSVDKSLKIVDYESGEVEHIISPHKAAILCFAIHPRQRRYLLTGSMDGSAILTDLISLQPLQTFRHAKFVIRCAFSSCGRWMATASYDHTIVIYECTDSSDLTPGPKHWSTIDEDDDMLLIDEDDDPDLAKEPTMRFVERFKINLKANPESIEFHPMSTYLLYTLRGSHLLHYVSLPTEKIDASAPSPFNITYKSFNPHPLDTHVSFSVLNMAIHPSGKIIACQTGDHAGRGGERILLYGLEPDEEGKERLACLWTGEEGDDYVLPRMAWLPDGTGLVTTTVTGHLILVDLAGKVRSKLQVHGGIVNGAHSSEVVRDLAVVKGSEDGVDWKIVSIGYDGRICVTA